MGGGGEGGGGPTARASRSPESSMAESRHPARPATDEDLRRRAQRRKGRDCPSGFLHPCPASFLGRIACLCWAVQAGLLTPLTFARHRLSPLAAFTSDAYFLHNGRR